VCGLPFGVVTVWMMFVCVITVVAPSLLVAASGVVLKLSVDFIVLAWNVDALPTDGAEELLVRGVGWLEH